MSDEPTFYSEAVHPLDPIRIPIAARRLLLALDNQKIRDPYSLNVKMASDDLRALLEFHEGDRTGDAAQSIRPPEPDEVRSFAGSVSGLINDLDDVRARLSDLLLTLPPGDIGDLLEDAKNAISNAEDLIEAEWA